MTSVPRAACGTCGQAVARSVPLSGLCAACLIRSALQDAETDSEPRCRVLNILGRGAQSISYLAESTEARDRLVVLKVSEVAITQRHRECIAACADQIVRLAAPGVARTRQVGCGIKAFLVRDFLVGVPLTSFLRRHSSNADTRARLVADVRQAVAAIHSAGLWHGHLTASNVIIVNGRQNPRAVVVDLGVGALTEMHAAEAAAAVAQDQAATEQLACSLVGAGPRHDPA